MTSSFSLLGCIDIDFISSPKIQSLNLEDQIESGESELKKLKTEENSFKRLMIVKKEKLATAQFKINQKHEDVKQYKRSVIEYAFISHFNALESNYKKLVLFFPPFPDSKLLHAYFLEVLYTFTKTDELMLHCVKI